MDEHFTCRNGHRWRLSLDSPIGINPRWVFCPVCGTAPMPEASLGLWKRFSRWAQRNPAAVGLLASILVMLAAFGSIARMQWRDMSASIKQLEQEADQAKRKAEDWRQQAFEARKAVAIQREARE
jgi:hypothetical protein